MKSITLEEGMSLLVNEEGKVFTRNGEEIKPENDYVPCREDGPDKWADKYFIKKGSWYFNANEEWKFAINDIVGYSSEELNIIVVSKENEKCCVRNILGCNY